MNRTEHPNDGKEAGKTTGLSGLAHTAETDCSSSARSASVPSSKNMIAQEGSSAGTPKKQRPIWDVWERVLVEDVSVIHDGEKVYFFTLAYLYSHLLLLLNICSGTRCALVGRGALGSQFCYKEHL